MKDRDTIAREEKALMEEHIERGGGLFHAFWRGPLPERRQYESHPGGECQVRWEEWQQRESERRQRIGLLDGANDTQPASLRPRANEQEELPGMKQLLRVARAQQDAD